MAILSNILFTCFNNNNNNSNNNDAARATPNRNLNSNSYPQFQNQNPIITLVGDFIVGTIIVAWKKYQMTIGDCDFHKALST